ncbi:MAG: right-handed parallel beta-helix repeat-containing protein, partial [Clostridia bacterium]|nr:right-handed parallel beta-helix repeat-containing protein [Clostridia bacterium]
LVYTQPKPQSKYTEQPYALVDDADLYVAVDGDDKNPGTKDKPLATFDAARLKVRELKKTAKDEIVVAFFAGNYGVLDNVTFTAEDAGTKEVPIKYCKYGDGEVIFRNGVYIEEEEFTLVTGEEAKKFKKDAQPYIYKVDLTGRVDKFTNSTRLFTSVGVADEAREPNNRFYTNVTTTVDDHASIQLQDYLPGIVEKFSSYEGVKVNGFLRTGWLVDCFPILSYDKETAILTFDFENAGFENGYSLDTFPLMYEGRTDDLIYFSNLPEFLDIANEFYFDNKTSTLYVYRAKGDYAIDGGKEFITVDTGADHLTFCGFEFSTTSGNGFIVKANYFTMDLCKIGNIGGHAAINADITPVHDFTVKNSEFYNFVDTGIFLLSAADAHKHKLESANNVIVNNYFHDFTLPMYFSSAIEISRDVGGYIAHNEFYQGSHGGIRYNDCIDLVIEYNVFDEMMTRTQDFGAVYTWCSAAFRDNHIRYNMFNNCHFIAIYLDNNTMGQHVYGNIFYNSADITQNGGCRGNYIHDNIQIK